MEDFQAEDTKIKQAVQSCLVSTIMYMVVFLFEYCCCIDSRHLLTISGHIIHVSMLRQLLLALFPGLPCLWFLTMHLQYAETGGGEGRG